ncbi:hypothetical protein [uncultured Streptococcus sp.]|uniref:hypothetical protein n=1 Tax=uncultured Streptococcus sp. TaxID=83427 RepID=UPI0028D150A9|nr:hypothetical protein [uncultured Streptococcus sp.]
MNYNLKYLLSGIFIIVFIGFLVWMSYFNQRKEEEHSDVSKELFRVVMIFVIGIILILMTPVLFKVVMELFSK